MKKQIRYLLLAVLFIFPLNVFASSMYYEYRIPNSSTLEVTITARVTSGTVNKYKADLTLTENLAYSEVVPNEGWTMTYVDGKLEAINEQGVTTNTKIGKIIFTRSDRLTWKVSSTNSELCSGDVCSKVNNNTLPGSIKTVADGPITNPTTGLISSIAFLGFAIISFVVYQLVNRKKLFKNL